MKHLTALTFLASLTAMSIGQDAPKPPAKPEVKKDEPKEGAPKEDDVQQTTDRIAENAKKAGDRLKGKDPGAETREIQNEIVKDIDALIKKAQQPPPMQNDMSPTMPPPKDGMPPPKDGMPPPKGGTPPPMGGTGKEPKSPMGMGSGTPESKQNPGRRPRRERKPRGEGPKDDPMANANPGGMKPMPAMFDPKSPPSGKEPKGKDGANDRFGQASPKRENDKMAELYKDVWGHLPERLRQEMDLYYREQFMPRYSELLRQYYAALAEQRKKGSEDR
jgi:hypothetical protein